MIKWWDGFAYYDDAPLNRWLDVGISIYDQHRWQQVLVELLYRNGLTGYGLKRRSHIGLTVVR